ncbi:hypothetical protein V1478_001409 [Vespula squamosa]|uniref:Uncharacterized protein n=1 Tax=Vespula squamosa TaxID=30214 RepID=A0ABD2C355_VESSQ
MRNRNTNTSKREIDVSTKQTVPPRALLVVVQGYTCISEGGTWEGTLPWRLRSKCTPSVEFRMHSEENRHTPIPPTLLTSNSILPRPSAVNFFSEF